jgi:hypothetical protein
MLMTHILVIVLACNVESRKAELDNIERWASASNLKLNRAKATEIIFVYKSRRLYNPIRRRLHLWRVSTETRTSLKILGVRLNSSLIFREHVK